MRSNPPSRIMGAESETTMIIGMAFDHIKTDILTNQDYQDLEQKLLTIEGTALVYMPSPSRLIRHLIDHGRLFRDVPVKQVKGKPGRCHDNVETLWAKHKDKYTMMHGYALSPDGLWRQHSWLLESGNTIIETTVLRVAYYGVAL